jgi:signal transduction histidine kinase
MAMSVFTNGPPRCWPFLGERYVKGDMSIHVHFGVGSTRDELRADDYIQTTTRARGMSFAATRLRPRRRCDRPKTWGGAAWASSGGRSGCCAATTSATRRWILGIAFPWVLGRAVARQAQLAAQLEATRRELAEQTLLEERRRIARDVHDFVGQRAGRRDAS